jgi:hypothetical protein
MPLTEGLKSVYRIVCPFWPGDPDYVELEFTRGRRVTASRSIRSKTRDREAPPHLRGGGWEAVQEALNIVYLLYVEWNRVCTPKSTEKDRSKLDFGKIAHLYDERKLNILFWIPVSG